MYTGCSSLASAPELLAEVLVDHCYYNMFFGCTNLQYIKCLATDISASNCTTNWTYNVSSTGVFVRDVSMNSWLSGSNGIPKGWTIETNTAEKYEAVDLGLSVKWADMNLGATKPEEYGDYYAWGETATKTDYTWESYLLSEGRYNSLQKYNFKDSYGVVDGKNTLDDEDDAAYNGLGANWRMPTIDEFRELQEECDWTWTNNNGIKGYLVKSKTTDKSIFLPAAGYKENDSDPTLGYFANYWTASLHNVDPSCAWCLVFSSGSIASNSCNRRYYGYSIRPVSAQ